MRKAFAYNVEIGLLLCYKLVMDACYLWYVYEPRIYGPYDSDLTWGGYLFAWIICAAIIVLFRETVQKPLEEYKFSEFILIVLLLLSVIPGLSMCGMGAFPWEYRWIFSLYWLLFFLLERGFSYVKLQEPELMGRLSGQAAKGILFSSGLVVAVFIVFVFIYYGGGRFFVSELQSPELYVQRLNFGKITFMFPLNYIKANAGVVFLFLLLFFLGNRRYGWAGLVMFVWYMEFSCTPNKIELFSALIGVFVYAVRKQFTIRRMLYLSMGIAISGMFFFSSYGSVYIMSFLTRVSFESNLLGYCYYDFFQSHAPIMDQFWGIPVLDRREIPFMIGAQYLDHPTTHANNGLLGDAFLMVGMYGVLLGPVLWQAYLYIVDRASLHLEWWIKLAVSVFWAVTMQNSAWATSMLSHGGVAIIVLAYLCGEAERQGTAFGVRSKVVRSNLNDDEEVR